MSSLTAEDRIERYRNLWRYAKVCFSVVLAKTFLSILWEYRLYFPADFESSFLSGRRYTFFGSYRWYFYIHILSSPVALVLGTALYLSARNGKHWRLHRILGRAQILIVLILVMPTGLMLAQQAYAGPIATWAFSLQAIATGFCALATTWFARNKQIDRHQQWAERCFLLLCTPLMFRLVSGAAIVMGFDTETLYQCNAWISWLLPFAAFEVWNRRHSAAEIRKTTHSINFSNPTRLPNEC